MSLTTDKNHPGINKPKGEGQQNKAYLILSEEERAKGFVRPVRNSYTHVGKDINSWWKGIHCILNEEEKKEFPDKNFVAIMTILTYEDGRHKGGPYITQKELDAWKKGERIGGCGTSTKMVRQIAETYARDPKYYGTTWCMKCQKHINVGEFIWDDGSEKNVGS